MGDLSQGIAKVGGRRVLLALGGLYIAAAAGSPVLQVVEGRAVDDILVIAILVGGTGLALLYGGYQLPRTDIRPDLYGDIARWSLRAIGVLLGILLLVEVVAGMDDPVATILILTPLASVAGLGMGIHDARAKTRALDAEEYSQELERYQTIVESVNDGIYVTNENNRFTLVNDAYCELVGYAREELLGSSSSLVLADEADVESLVKRLQRDLAEGATDSKTYETVLETASGEVIDVEWSVSSLPEQEGATADTVGVVRDVTERNERERQLEHQNAQLDSFAGMLAHELRNPVNIGQIYSQQLSADANQEAVEYIAEAFDRIENMIDVMLVVARGRKAVSESTHIQLAEVAQDVWAKVDAPNATLEVAIDQTIEADETYIQHLFRNLFENAVEHGGDDVTVTVGELPTGFYVADDGTGIPADGREEVFETGYTTTSEHGGMGVGLTFVQEMADVYGWECSVTASNAGGAQFEFGNVTKTHNVTE